jgi:hypothetical protein
MPNSTDFSFIFVHWYNVANYRPVAQLTTFSSVLEKVIYNRLCYCVRYNTLVPEQFGCPKEISQIIRPGARVSFLFRNKLVVLRRGVVTPPPNSQTGGPPPVGYLRLLIQYFRSCRPHLEAVSFIRNLRRDMPCRQGTHLTWHGKRQ